MVYDTIDTIAAIATPLGESGIGIIRISGSQAYAVGDAIFRSTSSTPLAKRRDRSIQYGTIVDEQNKPVDEVILLIPIQQKMYWKFSAMAGGSHWKKLWALSFATVPGLPIPANLRSVRLLMAVSI